MTKSSSFHKPMEPDWHRMISEAAFFLAEKRGFEPGRALDDWLEAERTVKELLSGRQNEASENPPAQKPTLGVD